MSDFASVPMKFVGPIRIGSEIMSGEIEVPLATYETPFGHLLIVELVSQCMQIKKFSVRLLMIV